MFSVYLVFAAEQEMGTFGGRIEKMGMKFTSDHTIFHVISSPARNGTSPKSVNGN
jgi:hypothetical protein